MLEMNMETPVNCSTNLGDAVMFLGLPIADSHLGGLSAYLRKYGDDDLQVLAEHIAGCEPFINPILESWGLPTNEGPSWWITDVLPAIKAEIDRRSRHKRQYSGNSSITRLKQLDLATVVSRYTELKRAGPGKLKGRCPLHNEHTPSFYVYEDRQRWHCFGACATGGDVVNLLASLRRKRSPHV
jgi:hypothetical protein